MRPSGDGWWRIATAAGAVGALGVAAVAAQAPAQAPTPGSQTPRFRAEANVVTVEATVVDRRGAVISGLGVADFKVEIDGKAREVASADFVDHSRAAAAGTDPADADMELSTNAPIESGRVILLVIDQASLRAESRGVIDAARRWVMSLGPRDRTGLITFPLSGPRVEFTTDHAKVAEVLQRVSGIGLPAQPHVARNISLWEAFRIIEDDAFVRGEVVRRECRNEDQRCPPEVDMQARAMVVDAQATVQPVLQGLRQVVRSLGVLPGPKHAVLLSSGWPIIEKEASIDMGWIAADAAASNVIMHTFTSDQWALAASRSKPSSRNIEDQNLLLTSVEMLSGLTGGRAVRLTNAYDAAAAALDAGLAGYYRLGVHALPADFDGKPHRISVKVVRPGATLASHRRVLAPAPPAPPATARAAGNGDGALREALQRGASLTGLELRTTVYVMHAAAAPIRDLGRDSGRDSGRDLGRDIRVVVVGDVRRATGGVATAVAALYELDGRPVTARENSVLVPEDGPGALSIELTAPPGTYALRVAVLDAEGHLGSLERLIDARWKKVGPIETPGLVLFRAGGAAPDDAPKPVFDHVTAADRLIAQVALPRAAAPTTAPITFDIARYGSTTVLLRRAARIAQTTGGTTVAQETWPASVLPPGRYTVAVRVAGSGASLARSFVVRAAPAASAGTAAPPPGFVRPPFSTAAVLAGFAASTDERLAAKPDAASAFATGVGRLQAGDVEAAARAFRTTLTALPEFTPALVYLGACYAAGGNDAEAARTWQRVLANDTMSPLVQRLAIEAWLRAGRPAAAVPLIEQARQRWPDDTSFVPLQAQAALADGRVQEGLQLIATAAPSDPPTLLAALGTLYDGWRRRAPVWSATRDLETMRRLRDAYATQQPADALGLVDVWIAEMAKGAAR